MLQSFVQYVRGRGACRVLPCLAMLVCLMVPVAAWANAFTIPAVPVDVTAKTPSLARQQALIKGQEDAFQRLLKSVVSPEDLDLLPKLEIGTLEGLVSDFSVANEKSSATRYIATMTVNFDESRVAQFLKQHGVTMVQGGEQTIVLLGVYQPGPEDAPLLWEADNPWRMLLNQAAVSRGLFPVALPLGDQVDASQVTAQDALAMNRQAMDSLMQRYGADEVVVAYVQTKTEAGSQLRLRRYPQDLPAHLKRGATPIADDLPAALGDLASQAVLAVARGEKDQLQAMMLGETEALAALVPVQSLADWVRVETALSALPSVKSVRLLASRTDVVQASIRYSGALPALQKSLENLGLVVRPYQGYWQISSPANATAVLP